MGPRTDNHPKVGLALGGGGAKGLAHIGVLKVLHEAEIHIHAVAGTSVGAFVGAAYASGMSIEDMVRVARNLRWSHLGKLAVSRLGFRDGSRMEELLREVLPVHTFEKLRIPFAVVATDIMTGSKIVIKTGDIPLAVRASSAIPGYFTPVPYHNDQLLVDGGVVDSLPVSVARSLGAEKIIAVDVHPFTRMEEPPTNLYQIYSQSYAIMGYNSGNASRQEADLLIVPRLSHVSWDDLTKADEAIQAGEIAMRRSLTRCMRLAGRKQPGIWSRLRGALAPRGSH